MRTHVFVTSSRALLVVLATATALAVAVSHPEAAAAAVTAPNLSAPADLDVGESAGSVSLPVRLSTPSASTVTVAYATNAFTAGSGGCNNLIQNVAGTLTFAAGVTSQSVSVPLNNCHVGGYFSFIFNLSNPTNAQIARPSTRIGIVGDPAAVTDPGLYVRDLTVDTHAGVVNVPVFLGGPAGATSLSTITARYATVDGTATAGTDYTATTGTITFGPGQSEQNIAIPITPRTDNAPTRRFSIALSRPVNATITQATGTVVIGASGATALASPTITAPPDQQVGQADGYLDLPVVLSTPGTRTVTVAYATNGFTAGDGGCNNLTRGATGTLTYLPGQTLQTVRVDLNRCTIGGYFSFIFTLSNPTNAQIVRPSTRIGIVGDPAAITDPGIYVRDLTVDTQAGAVNVPVFLGGPAGATSLSTVTARYATVDGTASAGTDYTATTGTITFGPGQSERNIAIPITSRTDNAPTRRFTVTLSRPVNATITQATGTVVIGASGATAVATPTISAPPDQQVGQADGYLDLPVVMSTPGTRTVTVAYATNGFTAGDGGCNNQIRGATGTLTYVPGQTLQTVRVDLNNCTITSGYHSFQLLLSSPTNAILAGKGYTQIGIVGNPAAVTDPGLDVRDLTVDTHAGVVYVPVFLGGPAGATSLSTITARYATVDGTAKAGTDYTATTGTVTFGPGQSEGNIAIPITARTDNARTRRFTIRLSRPVDATITQGTGTVVIGASGGTVQLRPAVSVPSALTVGEATGYVDIPVALAAPGSKNVTVSYATANGTATSGACNNTYRAVSGTLTFVPGVTLQTVRVELNNCGIATPGAFSFTLSSPINATLGTATTTVTIVQTPAAAD